MREKLRDEIGEEITRFIFRLKDREEPVKNLDLEKTLKELEEMRKDLDQDTLQNLVFKSSKFKNFLKNAGLELKNLPKIEDIKRIEKITEIVDNLYRRRETGITFDKIYGLFSSTSLDALHLAVKKGYLDRLVMDSIPFYLPGGEISRITNLTKKIMKDLLLNGKFNDEDVLSKLRNEAHLENNQLKKIVDKVYKELEDTQILRKFGNSYFTFFIDINGFNFDPFFLDSCEKRIESAPIYVSILDILANSRTGMIEDRAETLATYFEKKGYQVIRDISEFESRGLYVRKKV